MPGFKAYPRYEIVVQARLTGINLKDGTLIQLSGRPDNNYFAGSFIKVKGKRIVRLIVTCPLTGIITSIAAAKLNPEEKEFLEFCVAEAFKLDESKQAERGTT